VAYRRAESERLAHAMPPQDITLTQEETFTGGLCLVGIEPVSNYILLGQEAQARDQDTWQACMEQALAGLNCKGIRSASMRRRACAPMWNITLGRITRRTSSMCSMN
jgi:hypothetical protein